MSPQRRTGKALRILVLEPYYGGSHKSFLAGLARLPFSFTFLTLPARKWKWRMRLAAPHYARILREGEDRFDRILCSTFVDVAAFRGIAPSWVHDVPVLTYFHENQFAYPVRAGDERDFHFALTNVTTALASDCLAFNSEYNLSSFLDGITGLQRKSYDLKLDDPCKAIREKSRVMPPGIDFSVIDAVPRKPAAGPPVVLWNHRWEHDKNPGLFFRTLFDLDRAGIDFRLIVLGQSFREHPPVFDEARQRLSSRILHFGHVRSRRDYARLLRQGDIVVSTASHEFFGISVLEAVRAGCRPLLPDRLSYPELFPEAYRYRGNRLSGPLREAVLREQVLSGSTVHELTERYSWKTLYPVYEQWISEAERR